MLYLCVIWLVVEIFFWFNIKIKINNLNKINYQNDKKNKDKSNTILKTLDIISNLKSYSVNKFLEGFFLLDTNCSIYNINDIKYDNMVSFLAWACFNKNSNEISINQKNKIIETIQTINDKYNITFKEGYNENINHAKMTLEPINYIHQPFILYVIYWLLHKLFDTVLYIMGYRRYSCNGYNYLYKHSYNNCNNKSSTVNIPIVFFHGISSGWYPYYLFIKQFNKNKSVILFEVDPYRIGSLDFSEVNPVNICNTLNEILNRYNYQKCDIIDHSFGTITASWFTKYYPEKINKLVLIDVISILLSLPEVVHNFLYKKPLTLFHKIISISAAKEVTIAHSLHRNFNWYDNILWLEDIPESVELVVSVSHGDEIIPTKSIIEYLEGKNVIVWDDFSHLQSVSTSSIAINEIHKQINNEINN